MKNLINYIILNENFIIIKKEFQEKKIYILFHNLNN